MDKFVRKKPRLDIAVSRFGCGAGMATHEPETEVTERSDASEPVSWAYSLPYFRNNSCLLYLRCDAPEHRTRMRIGPLSGLPIVHVVSHFSHSLQDRLL